MTGSARLPSARKRHIAASDEPGFAISALRMAIAVVSVAVMSSGTWRTSWMKSSVLPSKDGGTESSTESEFSPRAVSFF